jgi:Co/Zn/Cd efflux system component
MAHHRRKVGAATVLNTAISLGEACAALHSGSLSLLVDSVHNLSDELALVCLYLAFFLPGYLGRHSQRTANILNSAGLMAISTGLAWEAVARLAHPAPVQGVVPIAAGLAAAGGNWGVAFLLREPARHNAAVRLAYLHNRGDVSVSLAPVAAGLLIASTNLASFDPLIGLAVALWLVASTVREFVMSSGALLWPEEMICGHGHGAVSFPSVRDS